MGKRRDEKSNWIEALSGRAQWTESDAQRVLEALAESGDTLTGFARRHGLTPQRISWWRVRLGDWVPAGPSDRSSCEPSESSFIPVIASKSEVGSQRVIAVVRFGDVAIDVLDPGEATTAWLASFVDALGARV